MNTILIVEDEQDLLDLMEFTLTKASYDVIGCVDTTNVKDILDEENVSLILMDRNLPGTEGSVFVQKLREDGYNQPVIYVSAKDSTEDVLEGFDRSADDYITKPFDLKVLVARVKAVLQRVNPKNDVLKVRDIEYISKNMKFIIDGEEVKLTHLEHDLLLEFMKNQDILLSREILLENVWEDSFDTKLKTVNVAVKRLKEKIDPKNKKEYIKSIRGEGYIFC
jgi:DNA-binding response OmpR family regulator